MMRGGGDSLASASFAAATTREHLATAGTSTARDNVLVVYTKHSWTQEDAHCLKRSNMDQKLSLPLTSSTAVTKVGLAVVEVAVDELVQTEVLLGLEHVGQLQTVGLVVLVLVEPHLLLLLQRPRLAPEATASAAQHRRRAAAQPQQQRTAHSN